MNEHDDLELRLLIRQAMPPLGGAEPSRDLWPRMLERLDRAPVAINWLDWLLVALGALSLCIFPEAIPGVLYHL